MTARRSPAWTVYHALYPTTAARLQLLTADPADGVFGDGRAFFADVPVETRTGLRGALEVALPRGAPDEGLRRWLEGTGTAGLVDAALRVEAPLVLEPSRFPATRVPAMYARGLAIGSARAVELLRALSAPDAAPDLRGVVRAELDATYRALIPDAAEQVATLLEHAAWLEWLADRDGLPPVEPSAAPDVAPVALPESAHRYEPLRRPLLAQAARLAARAQRQGEENYAAPRAVRTVLVGRLAHTQVVRLCGLGFPHELRWEAALVRNLAAQGA